MAIKELFYDQRPIALLDPRASNRLDPRFTFTRNSTATYFDREGVMRSASIGAPRLEYSFGSKEYRGLLIEPSSSNLFQNSSLIQSGATFIPDNWAGWNPAVFYRSTAIAPDGQANILLHGAVNLNGGGLRQLKAGLTPNGVYAMSIYARRPTSAELAEFVAQYGATTGTGAGATNKPWSPAIDIRFDVVPTSAHALPSSGEWVRCAAKVTAASDGTLNAIFNTRQVALAEGAVVAFWGGQLEPLPYATSLIPTAIGATATRAADLLSVDSLSIPSTGSVYIDAQAVGANANDTLISLKNASNQKINLAFNSNAATYNSLALIASYNGTSKSSLPLPVPTTDRERNIITWGAQNYQYGRDSSRFASSLSASVPANLTQLSIGHDAVDPTKAFNGYINTVYMWSGELTPAVAEALVRNDLDPINADTYAPVGPAGSLALVINTQGATASGNKVFTLPAESVLNDNDIVITWGDGTESGLDGAAAELGAPGLAHTYPAAGIYPVWVEGKMQNLKFNNSADAGDLLQIAAWGTGNMMTAPSTMNAAFYGCSQLQSIPNSGIPNTSAIADWYRAFRGCSSLTGTFPSFNFSAATTLQEAFYGCSSITSFTAAGDQTQNVTNFSQAWQSCSSLTSFPLINTSSGTDFNSAWFNCSSLTSFPLINTAAGTGFYQAWYGCSSLTSFPLINTAAGISFSNTWFNCSSLTSFPLINTAAGTGFNSAWYLCTSLTSFPLINTAAGIDFREAWLGCSSLTSFPLIDTAAGTNFGSTWRDCSSLTSFPLINTAAGTNFGAAWQSCFSLTSFPLIDTAAGTNFGSAWFNCTSLTSFPLIDTAAGTSFSRAWYNNDGLTAFPALDFDAAVGLASDASNTYTGFRETWFSCGALANFPANIFDNTTCTRYLDAFTGCALTAQSIENILVSINTAGTSNGNLSLQGGTNAGASTWTAPAIAAYDALVARGWTITRNA